jgi:hypothetical protein
VSSWEAALELINLGFLISHGNYLTFLQASKTVLEAYNWTDPEKTSLPENAPHRIPTAFRTAPLAIPTGLACAL